MEANLRPCPGSSRVGDDRRWYVPIGMTPTDCTYCEECYEKGFVDKNTVYLWQGPRLKDCCCDCVRPNTVTSLTRDRISVSVCDTVSNVSFPRLDSSLTPIGAPENGVMHVVLPTPANYKIVLQNQDSGFKTRYFSIESCKVGGKDVKINNGQRIYYPQTATIASFETGTNKSFLFISPSNRELAEGVKIEGINETNVVEITIKRWNRVIPQRPRHFNWFIRDDLDRYGRMGFARPAGFGTNVPQMHNDLFGGFAKMEAGSAMGAAASTMPAGVPFTGGFVSSDSVHGGATTSGNNYTSHVNATYTNDLFEQVGETIKFTVQLVNTQNDETRYKSNMQYRVANAQKLLAPLNKSIHTQTLQIESYETMLADARNKLDKLHQERAELEATMSTQPMINFN